MVEYNGRYYWPDLNRFCVYNGAVEDLPNDMNINYFYDNVNVTARQKVWGTKVPRFNEIWWFWPKGNATECTDVLIYNIKDRIWYDTAWAADQAARSCGIFSKSFPFPIMFGIDPDAADHYTLWQHEYGYDKIVGGVPSAIRSYFTTANIAYCANLTPDQWTGLDRWVQLMRVEPDLAQTGDMSMYIGGRKYAKSTDDQTTGPYNFSTNTPKIDVKEQRREMTLTFESNTQGGTYQLGQTLLSLKVGDGRQ